MAEWSSGFRSGVRAGLVTIAALSLAIACRRAPEPVRTRGSAATAAAGLVCSETDTHGVHAKSRIPCRACHPAGAEIGFSVVYTYPGGTTTAGGTITYRSGDVPTSCSVACHSPLGSPPHTVTWGTPGPLDCTACHDTTVLTQHPAVSPTAQRSECIVCHDQTNHTSGAVTLVSHPAGWMDPTSQAFHAYSADRGLASCEACHGPRLTGGMAQIACAQCHDRPLPGGGMLAWSADCSMCHGGTDNATGAPPKGILGAASDPIGVGAHTSHLASAIAPAMDCTVCHVKPADALAGGHVDGGTAEVPFGGVALASNAQPSWDRAAGTCANVYCHGATLIGGAARAAPVWTGGAGEAACGKCHGVPPPSPHPTASGGLTGCVSCHPETMDAAGNVIAVSAGGKHLDGVIEAAGGHPAGWMDRASAGFHAYAVNAGIASCQGCHGANLDGVGGSATTSCASCHGAAWRTSCTMCHGGVANATGAPPQGTWGHETDALRVGAHTAHVTTTKMAALDCTACHVKPTDALSPGHVDGATGMTWGALATSGGAIPTWDRATGKCSSTYCHGNYAGQYAYQVYDWGSDTYYTEYVSYAGSRAAPSWTDGPMTCGSCHANPPRNDTWHLGHPGGTSCAICHPDASGDPVGTAITNPSLHMNGAIDVVPQWKSACFNCH